MNRKKIHNILTKLYKTQWKTVFNELDKQYTDKVIEIASDYEIRRQKAFTPILINGYNLNDKLNKYKNTIDAETFYEYVDENNSYIREYNVLTKKMHSELLNQCEKIKDFYEEIQDIVIPFAKKLSDVDEIFARLGHLKGKWFNMLITFDCNKIGESPTIFNENVNILNKKRSKIIEDLEIKMQKMENQTEDKPNKGQEYKKIFDHKEMNRLAEISGYIFNRTTGSHKVYIHSKTNKLVVIPQHKLEYGLMCGIQKQIKQNSL
jgi:predicted RNA binding protein YcfA (HicA-like mRNA interferase family)|nr:MAG TPA: HICA protein [Caudoviricetes sp.]